ncbi:unnamed protein product [Meganyctiphanes norvegica]|uniref:Ubiquitinyl hydrolase 1 n=1 Tax=Meganyctiphanes norvegica TaxID=48144 RepID=A0AAV2R4W5_MEGNR
MDDNNLNYFIKGVLPRRHHYKGTFTSDNICNNPILKINLLSKEAGCLMFVVNTLKSANVSYRVGHWVSFIIFKRNTGLYLKYFDSFGNTPKMYRNIALYIKNIKKTMSHSRITFLPRHF